MRNIIRKNILPREFYSRDPIRVARDILGKTLLRRINREYIGGPIVEVEAYVGVGDPASIIHQRSRRNIARGLYGEPGELFIYMVHGNWLLCITVDEAGKPSAIHIRAIEPKYGLPIMRMNRGVKDDRLLTSGPGRLTRALSIDKTLNGVKVYEADSPLIVVDEGMEISDEDIVEAHRIGVVRDLDIPLRFYIKGSRWVSRR